MHFGIKNKMLGLELVTYYNTSSVLIMKLWKRNNFKFGKIMLK